MAHTKFLEIPFCGSYMIYFEGSQINHMSYPIAYPCSANIFCPENKIFEKLFAQFRYHFLRLNAFVMKILDM